MILFSVSNFCHLKGESLPAVSETSEVEVRVLRVAADFSLRGVLGALGAKFADAREGSGEVVEIELDLAPGLELAERADLDPGRADVWLFLSPEPLQQLAQKGRLLPDTARTLAQDNLAVVSAWPAVRRGTPPPWQELAAARWKRIAVANFRTSPSGAAAVRVLKSAGLWDSLDYRVELIPNSDEVLLDVMRAQVDAAFVFRSESRRLIQRNSFTIWELAGEGSVFVVCGAVSQKAKQLGLARDFLVFVSKETGIWREWGYEPAGVKR